MKEWNIRKIMAMFWKGKILLIICMIIGAVVGYVYNAKYTNPIYESSGTIILSVYKEDNISEDAEQEYDSSELNLNERLMNTYSQIIKSDSVMNRVIENLNLNMTSKQLVKNLTITTESKSTIMKINVKSDNPELSAKIVRETVNVFFERIDELYKIKSSKMLDEPTVNRTPTNIMPKKFAFIGGAIGLVLAMSILLIKEFLNDNIKSESDVEKKLKLNVLAKIEHFRGKDKLVSLNEGKSSTEAFRVLASNTKALDSKVVLVTSNMPEEGKSVVSANLAIIYAKSGKKTLLIDSDMRRGTQHKLFELSDNMGLSNLVFDDDTHYEKYLNKEVVPNLDILPKGSANLNYSKLLFSEVVEKIIEDARDKYEFVIIDSAPCQMVADSTSIYRIIDSTIIVVKYNNTKYSDVNKICKDIKRNHGEVLGVVINNIPKEMGKYKSYNYYSPEGLQVSKHSKHTK